MKLKNVHIAAPIISDGEESNEEIDDLELNELDHREIQISNNENEIGIRNETNNEEDEIDMWNETNNEELNSEEQRLTQLIEEWELGNRENKFDFKYFYQQNGIVILIWNSDFNLGGRITSSG
ncbi:hypothetical protein Glove_627g41 [Diversispora epigaea]|uniref:Uncharacterized protein n=1 Tax=Diversispora epigaea TaxID=1348612 RepID=A0A397GBG0_9GLOM|nr:hypothetical protein Glove_627g41 [Diversispora epigaea]